MHCVGVVVACCDAMGDCVCVCVGQVYGDDSFAATGRIDEHRRLSDIAAVIYAARKQHPGAPNVCAIY